MVERNGVFDRTGWAKHLARQSLVWMRTSAILCACLIPAAAAAAAASDQRTRFGTRAGTAITNVATLRYDVPVAGPPATVRSNESTIIVAERLDLQLVRGDQSVIVLRGDPSAVPFALTNANNGAEAFSLATTLTATAGTAAPGVVRALAVDTDGDGRYDPAHDATLPTAITPVLAPGETLTLFAILSLPDGDTGGGDGAGSGALQMTARALTGSGSRGDAYPGQGDGGGDAVVGATGATATIVVPIARATAAGPSLSKSQSVRATDGSANPVRDAVITYTLDARFVGGLRAARVDDPLPAGTAYVAGSLLLDGRPLSDAADGDAGRVDGRTVSVALADIAAGATHSIQFKVRIQ